MLINNNYESDHVKFISYTGRYPKLCSGVLTLEIDGKVMKFGYFEGLEPFWRSGGYIDEDYEAVYGEWCIDVGKLPEKIRKYASEIDMVFNANVPMGCCGGCI